MGSDLNGILPANKKQQKHPLCRCKRWGSRRFHVAPDSFRRARAPVPRGERAHFARLRLGGPGGVHHPSHAAAQRAGPSIEIEIEVFGGVGGKRSSCNWIASCVCFVYFDFVPCTLPPQPATVTEKSSDLAIWVVVQPVRILSLFQISFFWMVWWWGFRKFCPLKVMFLARGSEDSPEYGPHCGRCLCSWSQHELLDPGFVKAKGG